jgi:hypothetical protein
MPYFGMSKPCGGLPSGRVGRASFHVLYWSFMPPMRSGRLCIHVLKASRLPMSVGRCPTHDCICVPQSAKFGIGLPLAHVSICCFHAAHGSLDAAGVAGEAGVAGVAAVGAVGLVTGGAAVPSALAGAAGVAGVAGVAEALELYVKRGPQSPRLPMPLIKRP